MTRTLSNTSKLAAVTFLANLYFYNHVSTLYQEFRGLDLFQVGSLSSIIIITIFLAEVPTGMIADKIGRKWSVVAALFLQSLGEWLYFFADSYAAFVLIAVIAGVGFAFMSGAAEALIYDTLPEKGREELMKKSMGRIGAAYQLAFFVSPLIGGVLVSQLALPDFQRVILFTAVAVTAALFVSLSLKEPKARYRHPEESPYQLFKLGARQLFADANLRRILLVTIFTSTFGMLLVSFYQPHLNASGVSIFWLGTALALGGLVAAVVQASAYRIEKIIGPQAALLVLALTPGFLFIGLALASVPAVLVVLFVVLYATAEAKNPLLSSYQNKLIPNARRATTLSLISMITSLYVAGAGLMLGRIAQYSIPLAFMIVGVLVVLSAIVFRADKIPAATQVAK